MTPPPRLVRYLTLATCLRLPAWSSGPHDDADLSGDLGPTLAAIAAAGYQGVQVYRPSQAEAVRVAGLDVAAIGRADTIAALRNFVERWEQTGAAVASVHLGTGFESPADGTRLVEELVALASTTPMELLLETHRATITQDPGRTLHLVSRFPELRFTADLAHWYTGVEMTYGGFDWKLEAIRPVLERVRLMHGRISSPGCAQEVVRIGDDRLFVEHFRRLWTETFRCVRSAADAPSTLPFAPELLPPHAGYARTTRDDLGAEREESDRWEQALLLCDLAEHWHADAATTS